MSKIYNITRESAAKVLWISTRTIDRYIKNGKLSYKKVANKVLLEKEEIALLQDDFAALHQEINTEIVNTAPVASSSSSKSSGSIDALDQKLDKFILVYKEKDKMIEEKNKLIFVLQQRLWELETKIKHMVALPDYNKEKQETIIEKEKLETKINELKWIVKNEKTKNLVFIGLAVVFIVIAWFVLLK
jgi:predicted site-specific integrase-resolvase